MKRWIHASTQSKILDRWYVISDDGAVNCCIEVEGYDKPMRGRSSMICLKEGDDEIYILSKANEDDYGVPGGGWDKGEDPKDAAIRELHEETLADIQNIKQMGLLIEYSDEVKDWVREHVADEISWWYGYYSVIFVGKYAGEFEGEVADEDRESDYKWIRFDEIKSELPIEYQKAVDNYLKENKL